MSKPVLQVVAGILWREGRYLAVQRPEGADHAGFWEFPGGKVESGESLEQALARELDEELGIAPKQIEFWRTKKHDYPQYGVVLHFYHVRTFSGDLVAREGQGLAWLDPVQPTDLEFLPADVEICRDLHDNT